MNTSRTDPRTTDELVAVVTRLHRDTVELEARQEALIDAIEATADEFMRERNQR